MTPDADASARLLTGRIRSQRPTAFFRFGDGPLECIYHRDKKGHTCDGERYSRQLASELVRICGRLFSNSEVFIGDWGREIATTAYREEWLQLTSGLRATLLHYEALLMARESAALVDFYRAVRQDRRHKLFMAPESNAAAARMLDAEHIPFPTHYDDLVEIAEIGQRLRDKHFDLLLFGAGMAGNIVAADCWLAHPERTYISVGSAMDPLFSRPSRSNQLKPERARALFSELLS